MAQKVILISVVVLAASIVERTWAQSKPGTKPPTTASAAKTTLSGVYTMAQADRGEAMYYNVCVNCHPRGTYAGPGFKANWNNKPLFDLWDWISNKMPKNDPGTLQPNEVADVMAYILHQNKMPAGKVPLPANEKAMYAIRIQIK